MEKLLSEMKEYALKNNVPIIFDDGLVELKSIINRFEIGSVLEIGTAIGYSALQMYLANSCTVVSIERDPVMYNEAVKNIKLANLEDKITLIHCDALECDTSEMDKVDLLYIDAAKSQYRKFFEKYEHLVTENGVVVFDNLNFHGMVDLDPKEIKNRNTRQLVGKLRKFREYISNHPDYLFEYVENGDGIGLAYRKGKK